ncbi:SusC/RagA family TonB-linked outer membrane protein, partial [Flavobacterium hauense]
MKTIYTKLLLLLLLLPFTALAQSTLKGIVSDAASGQPIPGANVIVEGTSNGTSTDMDGNFTLTNVKSGDRIVVSFIGYTNQVVEYSGQASLNISMQEDATQLQEVVVIGYGTTTKKDATGALTSITAEQFNKGPVVGAEQLIQGRVAGVQVITAGGEPGSGSLVRIRSGASLTANNDPLYIIDGVPVDTSGGSIKGGRNPLANVNQNDIASMTVLKDAAALAIYGSRASNGVVIITTKKGQSGEMKISYNANFQINEVVKTVNVMNANQYRAFVNEHGSAAQVALLGTANTNWQDEIYRNSFGTDHNVALSGGTDNIVYRASMGYTNIGGILEKDNFQRTSLSAGLVGNFFDRHLKVEVNNKTAIMDNNNSEKSAIGAAIAFDPTQPIRQDNAWGNYFQWATNGVPEVNASRNPIAFLNQKHNFGNTYRSIGNAQFDYKIHGFEDLKLVANFGYDFIEGREYGSTDINYVFAGDAGDNYENRETKKNKVMDLYANYSKYLEAIKTNIDVTGGYSYQDFRYEGSNYTYDYANDVTNFGNPYRERVNLQSYFGRATFTIDDKYILNGSFRADGSSRFTEENRWGYFPAAAAAWRISQEEFLANSNVVSDIKLRASWGITGQQEIGPRYPSVPLYSGSTNTAQYQTGYDVNGNPVFEITYRPLSYNKNLVWEETETLNFGIDFGFLKDRITGSVDYYKRKTNDLIVEAQNPQGVNFSNRAFYNIGDMENEGLELSLDVYPVKTDDITWRVGGNITFQKSEITKLTTSDVPGFQGYDVGGITGGTGTLIQNNQVGFAPNAFYVL